MDFKVLMLHNRYLIRGGEDECVDAELGLLNSRGCHAELREINNNLISGLGKIRAAGRTLWSFPAFNQVRREIKKNGFNLVHVHNFFPLWSPSVYYAAALEGVPIVQTLHNYRLLCPNALFYRESRICEDCPGHKIPWPGIQHRCYRNSFMGSATVASMIALHRFIGTWKQKVTLYIALSEFSRKKFIENGIPEKKIVVKPNFIYPDPGIGGGNGDYAIYVGRLCPEKGIRTVLQAWEKMNAKLKLFILGDGPLAQEMTEIANKAQSVVYLGRKSLDEVQQFIGEAKFLIFPSELYETFGRVAIEAFAKGTPVLAANLGAAAEITESGRNSLHFEAGNSDDLAAKADWLLSHPSQLAAMRREARLTYEGKYTADKNHQLLLSIYEKASH